MFIDYLSTMLLNLVAGYVVLAFFVLKLKEFDTMDKKKWVPAFLIVGAVSFLLGLHMTLTWPLPGAFNIAFGEASLLFGVLYLGTALALAKDWDLFPITIYAFFAGVAALVIGLRIMNLKITKEPVIAGVGFIFSGVVGILSPFGYRLRSHRVVGAVAAIVMFIAAVAGIIWIITGYEAFWGHIESFKDWKPLPMR